METTHTILFVKTGSLEDLKASVKAGRAAGCVCVVHVRGAV